MRIHRRHQAVHVFTPALFVAMSLIPSACAQQALANAPSPAQEVRIDNFSFTPAEISVERGSTVTWTNGDDIPHTVAATNKAFRSKVMDTDQRYSFTFTVPGTYDYFCALHPHMQGKV